MATEAQIKANRQNASKSTGPRTAEGKAAVSQNAVKHGLFASATVINGEDRADFELHRDTMLADLSPVGAMESMLASRIVSLSWRLLRTERMQTQAMDDLVEWIIKPSPFELYNMAMIPAFMRESEEYLHVPKPKDALGRTARRDWAGDRIIERLMIYEQRIESSMYKAMNKFNILQATRKKQKEAEQEMPAETARPADEKAFLKKQSQSSPRAMGARLT